jgi:competence protein ComEA
MRHVNQTAAVLLVALLLGGLAAAQAPANQSGGSPTAAPAGAQVNLNTATAADLEVLPGIGPTLAARIIEHRQKSGGFKKIEELMTIKGIGEKQFLRLKPLVTVTPIKTDRAPALPIG